MTSANLESRDSSAVASWLPHEHKDIFFLTDSGMETQIIFQSDLILRDFAAFELLNSAKGRDYLRRYYRRHIDSLVVDHHGVDDATSFNNDLKLGFVLESVLWCANPDWLIKLGYDPDMDLSKICQDSMDFLEDLKQEYSNNDNHTPMVKSGTIGPRSDGYVVESKMTVDQAKKYHLPQIQAMAQAGADLVSAMTINYLEEGIGIAVAARHVNIPVVLSFTVETNGCLLTGESIPEIIAQVDAATDSYPAYYMMNCAHPSHFSSRLGGTGGSKNHGDNSRKHRIGGLRSNASKLSHAELDNSEDLDDGDPVEFGQDTNGVLKLLPSVNVVGGCCGTDLRHVMQVKEVCLGTFRAKNNVLVATK